MKRLPLLLVALLLLVAPAAAGEVWEKQLGEEITAVATDERGDRIFVGTESGKLYCYDSAGNVAWTKSLSHSITEIHCPQTNQIFVETSGCSYIISSTGEIISQISYTGTSNYAINRDGSLQALLRAAPSGAWSCLFLTSPHGVVSAISGITVGASAATDIRMSGNGDWAVLQASSSNTLDLWEIDQRDSWLYVTGYAPLYRKKLTITNGDPTKTLTDCVIPVTCHKGSGTDSGRDMYFGLGSDSSFNNEFSQTWFTGADGTTELPAYRTGYVSGNYANFDVQLPGNIPPGGTYEIYVYYHSPWGPTATWEGLYLIADDFEDGTINPSLWAVTNGSSGTVQETNGYLELISPGSNGCSRVQASSIPQDCYVRMTVSVMDTYDSGNYNLMQFGTFWAHTSDAGIYDHSGFPTLQAYDGDWTGYAATLNTPQTMTITYVKEGDTTWSYGSDWSISHPSHATSYHPYFAAGRSGTAATGHLRIHDIRVATAPFQYLTTEVSYSWGPAESQFRKIASKSYTGTIIDINAPETGNWIAISTTTNTYLQEITDSGFGTTYSADRTGTPYQIQVADGGSFAIEGRNILADIFRIDAVQVGTYTTGGAVRAVAIAQKNGLYAAAGSDDGKYYVFSKDAASSWYLLHASDSYDPVTAIAMSWRGELLIVGRADGRLTAFQVSEQDATGAIRVTIYKDNIPYATAPLRIEDGGRDQSWGAPITLTTDDYGIVSIPVSWGNYIRITVGDDELTRVLVATPSQTEYVLRITGPDPLRTGAQYSSGYDPDTQRIYLHYDDTREKTHRVVYTIVRAADNAVVFEREYTDADLPLTDYYQIPAGWTNTSYRVHLTASGSPSFTNTWSQWVGVDGVAKLPGELDTFMKMGICFFLLLFVAGLFSYLTGPQGAVVVSMLAGALVLWGWLPLPPTVVALCIVWAFLGLLGRTSGE